MTQEESESGSKLSQPSSGHKVANATRVPLSDAALAARRAAVREAGRRKAGIPGAALAGALFALQDIYQRPPPEEIVIVADADGEPHDLDVDGVKLSIEGTQVEGPPANRAGPSRG